jgi:hypothetical protein
MIAALKPMSDGRYWYDVPPAEMVDSTLAPEEAPINEMGEPCPWPWDPQQLVNAPLGQYHCPYCGGMQVAGIRHLDWREDPEHQRVLAEASKPRNLDLATAKHKCHIGERGRCCAYLVGGPGGLECGYINPSLRATIRRKVDEGSMTARSGPCANPHDDESEAEDKSGETPSVP